MNFSFVSFLTPKKVNLKGLWLGSQKPENLYIFLHGLSGSIFSRSELMMSLANSKEAVLTFNNRGSGTINYFKKDNAKKEALLAGVAHEVFTDCLDDIDGAINYAREKKVKSIILIGHSTGCQKISYYLSKKNQPLVKGAILLAPISDYSNVNLLSSEDKKKYSQALKQSNNLIKFGKPHTLLSGDFIPKIIDAQRFVSLYTPDSVEEIFNYTAGGKSKTLSRIKVPILAFLAGSDEYGDRPAEDIAAWLELNSKKDRLLQTKIIPGADHGFSGWGLEIKRVIKNWVKRIK